MGKMIDGEWHDVWYATENGRFVRKPTTFRDAVTADGSSGFPAARGRYHLYVSLACPWAHRVLIVRALKRLEDVIGVTVVEPLMLDQGWVFSAERPDPLYGADALWQIYKRAAPDFTGRVTVPVLWDMEAETIVNNESSEILRMLDRAFDRFTDVRTDLYPEALRDEIDAVNARVYDTVNNGVYRAGFATTQEAYEEAVVELFDSLDWLDARLAGADWLVGGVQTEADWRLFTTLVRFDPVYHGHFKCNLRRLEDYPRLNAYLRRLARIPGVAGTIGYDDIKRHYYGSHKTINPTGVVPLGPARTALDD
ncbi:MAG: glutathione S-transferase family protein [Deltaproteobacteria bacterium]|nr:MAG: glutathione S-transferase family protein [Deltaproteobacteria bacterium]